MAITIRYFAGLKETLGRSEDSLPFLNDITVQRCWELCNPGQPMPVNTLAAVNMEYAALNEPVNDLDEVAFFPPVTGG